jgi:uncharacterized protein (DUF433 family)
MLTTSPIEHIRLDEHGVAWIDDTHIKVIEVIADHLAHPHSPEQIQSEHPHLTLAQVYAAFAYYHDHQAELDAEMKRRYQQAEALREQSPPFPSRKELLDRAKKA